MRHSFSACLKKRWYLLRNCRRCWNKICTSNYELDRLLLKRTNRKVIGLEKNELGGKIIKESAALRTKAYNYLTDNKGKYKKTKGTK